MLVLSGGVRSSKESRGVLKCGRFFLAAGSVLRGGCKRFVKVKRKCVADRRSRWAPEKRWPSGDSGFSLCCLRGLGESGASR